MLIETRTIDYVNGLQLGQAFIPLSQEKPSMRTAKRSINAIFRSMDESHKWPIHNRFNVTERAIRRLRQCPAHMHSTEFDAESYAQALSAEISRIVNGKI